MHDLASSTVSNALKKDNEWNWAKDEAVPLAQALALYTGDSGLKERCTAEVVTVKAYRFKAQHGDNVMKFLTEFQAFSCVLTMAQTPTMK